MRKTDDLCKSAIIAALYVALCFLNPISFGAIQFRVANALVVLPLLDKKHAPSILVGIALANCFSPLGLVDVLFGLAAEGIAYSIVVYGPGRKFPLPVKMLILTLSVSVIIGIELWASFSLPFIVVSSGLFVSTLVSLMIGWALFYKSPMRDVVMR